MGVVYEKTVLGLISLERWTNRNFDADEKCEMQNHHLGRECGIYFF